jgi:lysophospholipase L1-like esterase
MTLPLGDLLAAKWRPFRPLLAVVLGLALAGGAELVPALAPVRVFSTPKPWFPKKTPSEASNAASTPSVGAAEVAESSGPGIRVDVTEAPGARVFAPSAPETKAPETEPPPVSIEDADGAHLSKFYESLRETQSRREPPHVTRVLHLGDSIIVSDYVSSSLRQLMQKEFGDAGHGFVLAANGWPSYFHSDVFRASTRGFVTSRISGPTIPDRLYGLGGVSFRGSPGTRATFGTVDKGQIGRTVSLFRVSYLQMEGGGDVEVFVDGAVSEVIHTDGPTSAQTFELRVPDGPHRFELVLKSKPARLFGVVMEREVAGVTWSALGVQGARMSTLDENDDQHFAAQLRGEKPALIVFQFGINESGDGFAIPMPELRRRMTGVLTKAKNAAPDASCLVVGAMDRARLEEGQVTSMRVIPLIVAEQKAAAAAAGCAFFDTFHAMGGHGSMPRWVRRQLANPDMMHPSSVGADRIATWLFRALMAGYRTHLQKTDPKAPSAP